MVLENFSRFFKYESIGANDTQDMANLDLRGMVGKIYAGITIHCYIHNILDVGLMVLDFFFPFIVNGR